MSLCRVVLFLCLLLPGFFAARASETRAEHAANVYAAQQVASAPRHGNLRDYALPPEKLARAQHLATVSVTMYLFATVWEIVQVVLLLWFGVIARMRDRAVQVGNRVRARGRPALATALEGFLFALFYAAVALLLALPLRLYGHHLALGYGLSIESWASWAGDLAKDFALEWLGMGFAFVLLAAILRRFRRRWWLVAWAAVTPLVFFMTYLTPLVIDPIFNTFEPLQKTQPELVARLEQVVARGHMEIPPDRMFLMKASSKTTEMNAYVTGFGGSKRLVLWDTLLAKSTPDEVLLVFGHESGHYVLGHVTRGILMLIGGLLLAFFLADRFLGWALARFGRRWRIPSQGDWGALAVLMLALAILSAAAEPIVNTLSRSVEHAADVYGQEAVHGLVADPQAAAKGSFQVLGETSLDDPNPSPLAEFWLYSHPAIGRRAAFAAAYNPWAPGMQPKYFPKPGTPDKADPR